MKMPKHIDLSKYHEDHKISETILKFYAEAASVMLSKSTETKSPPTYFEFDSERKAEDHSFTWTVATDAQVRSHGNEKDATEEGAYAMAIAIVGAVEGYDVTHRTHQGSGSDFAMLKSGESEDNFIKLEVSGIAKGRSLQGRVKLKVKQVEGGDMQGDGKAVVVGFEARKIILRGIN